MARPIRIVAPKELWQDEAIKIAAAELRSAAEHSGIPLELVESGKGILLGDASRNPAVARLAEKGRLIPAQDLGDDGYELVTLGRGLSVLRGGTLRAEAYALLFLADRLRTTGRLPAKAFRRCPAFPLRTSYAYLSLAPSASPPYLDADRMAAALEAAKSQIRRAFLFGANQVLLRGWQEAIDWKDEILRARAQAYRGYLQQLLDFAHRLHLRLFVMDDEFLYIEDDLRAAGATLSPEDDKFWDFLRNKYRSLLRHLPDLDGIATRIGEQIPRGPFKAFDLIHNDSHLSLEEKYRRFLTNIHQVVVGEFGKTFYHRTWTVSDWEQHSVPEVYESIFSQVPTEGLIVSIKLTKTDQWAYQAYNPTLGLSPHTTNVELEMVRGPHGAQAYPDFLPPFFQPGLLYALARGVKGASFNLPHNLWMEATCYVSTRLMWTPRADLRQLARDWATLHFGAKAAKEVAEMLLLTDPAMVKALYVRPWASTHAWNPIPHLMSGMFVAEGNPLLDQGAGHLHFLREIYLHCRPWMKETLADLAEGQSLWGRALNHWRRAERHVPDRALAEQTTSALLLGQAFLALNAAYVTAFLRYFEYEENPTDKTRSLAWRCLENLSRARRDYLEHKGNFSLLGIEHFLECARLGLSDAQALARLRRAPSEAELHQRARQAMEQDARLLRECVHPIRLLYWEGNVDGRELITVTPEGVALEHLADEHPTAVRFEVFAQPQPGMRVVLRPLEARGLIYLVEQPSEENGGRFRFCVEDPQSGRALYRLEAYAVSGPPA